MYLKTCLLIALSIGVIQAKVYREMPGFLPPGDLVKEPKVREEFKCYFCHTGSEATCEKKEQVCKKEKSICITVTGKKYVLQCADMEFYKNTKEYCDKSNECQMTYCIESLCN